MTIEAEVREYVPNAMTDHFQGGGFASYDATRLRVTAPEGMRGRDLRFLHDAPVAGDSPWRRAGQSVRFEIDEALLEDGSLLFSGAVSGFEAVPPR